MKQILLTIVLILGLQSIAQKKDKELKESDKYFYKEVILETADYKATIIDAIAIGKYSKFKIKFFNKTKDYLFIKPDEFTFVSGDKKIICLDNSFVVEPNKEDSKVIDFKGSQMQVDKYVVEMKGIYKVSANGKIVPTSNFTLPPTKNEFTTGNFTCTLKNSEAKKDKTVAKFDCLYLGDGVGIMNPYKAVAVMPNGSDNANYKKNKAMILEKGKSDYFTLVFNEVTDAADMQKTGTQIKWTETFRVSKLVRLGALNAELVKDSK